MSDFLGLNFDSNALNINHSLSDQLSSAVINFFDNNDLFEWLLTVTHGMHESIGPEYSVYWDDVDLIKKGDSITFKHVKSGGGHNIMIKTGQLLEFAIISYLMSGNNNAGRLVELLSKGITATMKGMLFSRDDSEMFVMARNIIPHSFEIETADGVIFIDYSDWRNEKVEWNAHRFLNKNNPYWGDIYVTAIRSKDDLPHLFRPASLIPFIDESFISNSVNELFDYLRGFSRDVVNNGFIIKAKDPLGRVYFPKGDLASFSKYDWFSPNGELGAKITLSLFGFNELRTKISDLSNSLYESLAVRSHYYNYKIINGFHLTALMQAIINDNKELIGLLKSGLTKRVNRLFNGGVPKNVLSNPQWRPDLAVLLVQASTLGVPLTNPQIELVVDEFTKAFDAYSDFNFNIWSLPNGVYSWRGGYKPFINGLIPLEELGFLVEHSYSPLRSVELVNEDLISDLIS